MLENLIQTLPEERSPLLRQEMALLHRSAERLFPEAEDRLLAAGSDSQGMGGTCGQEPKHDERCETNSIWIMPVLSILLALAVVPLLHQLDQSLDWESGINPETVRTVLEMMASSMFTFIVFVCSALLIAVQLASTQLTPRIIALVFRDPVTKLSLTIFVFTFTFSQAVLVRINTEVPTLSARLAAYSCIACLGVFLFLIDHVGKWLRPSGALRAVP